MWEQNENISDKFVYSMLSKRFTNICTYICQVALVNGISMGGGASLMVPMMFSVVTEKTVSI